MNDAPTLWGLHMSRDHGTLPIEDGYVAIGWDELGDLTKINPDREAFKDALRVAYDGQKPGTVAVHAGILYRFAYEIKPGDIVVYPSKDDRMVNIGELGAYHFVTSGTDLRSAHNGYANRRHVRWLAQEPRSEFPQAALNEIGSALTLFQIANNPDPFLAVLKGDAPATSSEEEDAGEVAAVAEQVEERTEDFVLKRLKSALSPERFEHFVAQLLRCMGYHTRVTQLAGDGGIDVIAHRDELGFEPPVIKVQCKQVNSTIGRPDVQQLMGAVAGGEFGLFVTLGRFSRDALDTERNSPNLRLIDGPALAELVFEHYERFEPQWQSVVPLKRRYVPGPASGS